MAARDGSGRWLFGPGPDLLLGCGLGYILLFAVFVLSGVETRTVGVLGLVPLISILTGTPHYGATLLRVYEDPEERRRYAFFAVWVTAVVWAFFYAGLYSVTLGSLLVTIYLTWSPWHYTGQNYGIALMFLRRRGVPLAPGTKRVVYLSFLLSYGLTLLALHGATGEGEYSSVSPYQGGSFHLMRLGIPSPWWEIAFVGIGVVYLACLGAAATLLLRRASARDVAPAAALALTQMMWFALPAAARHWGLLGPDAVLSTDRTAYAFFWVATGHSVQYLWITTYYAAGGRPAATRLLYLAKTLAAGSFIWSVPGLVYGLTVEGGRFGGVARGQDVFLLLASVVNIHHFILDGAIWKLRDGRVARILIRREPESPALPEPIGARRRRRWLAPAVYAIGGLATLQVLTSLAERQLRLEPALRAGDLRAAELSIQRLSWIRSDSHTDYLRLGNVAAAEGVVRVATRAYDQSLQKQPASGTWVQIGLLADQLGQREAAIQAYEKALEINEYDVQALNLLGLAWLAQGEPAKAEAVLERAVVLVPDAEVLQASLARARSRLEQPSASP